MATKKTATSFSKLFDELESITEWFERDDVDVEEGLKQFERGLELAKACKERLAEIEHRVEDIKQKYGD